MIHELVTTSGIEMLDTTTKTPDQMWSSYPLYFKRDEYMERVRTDIGTDYDQLFRLVELLTEGFLQFIDAGNWVGAKAYCDNLETESKLSSTDNDLLQGCMPTT